MPQEPELIIEVAPGEREYEEVGQLADGRQFLLTANLRPTVHGDEENRFLVLLVFDRAGLVAAVDVRTLGLRSAVDEESLKSIVATRLAELGAIVRCPIQIQPIDPVSLGPEFGPSVLQCEEEPELQLILETGAIVPGWPFGAED